MNYSLSVVIPVFNQVHWTRRCLQSLLDHTSAPAELFIVDNHSTDETPQFLKGMQPLFESKGWRFTIITNETNQGFGRACNQGIRESKSTYVAIMNNDTWMMPQWDAALVQAIEKLGAAMVGPHFYEKKFLDEIQDGNRDKKMIAKSSRFARRNKGKFREFWVPMLMFFRRSALDQVGIFDEEYFVTYEEIDLRVRFDRAGLKYYVVGDCFIWHAVKGTRNETRLIPSKHEEEGLKIFMRKWGFHPDELRPGYFNWPERLKRRWIRIKNGLDLF